MPKLYYTPSSCGAATFLAASIAGVSMDCEQVTLNDHKTASGADFYAINPKGNVPTIVLDDGTVLNEGAATLAWVADQAPGKIAPEYGTSARYLVIAGLNYVASEVHANFGPLFYPNSDEIKAKAKENLAKKFEHLVKVFESKPFLAGDSLSIADLYLYIVLSWVGYVGVELPAPLTAWYEKVKALPEVAAGHERMGTSPATTA